MTIERERDFFVLFVLQTCFSSLSCVIITSTNTNDKIFKRGKKKKKWKCLCHLCSSSSLLSLSLPFLNDTIECQKPWEVNLWTRIENKIHGGRNAQMFLWFKNFSCQSLQVLEHSRCNMFDVSLEQLFKAKEWNSKN